MMAIRLIGLTIVIALLAAAVIGAFLHSRDRAHAQSVWSGLQEAREAEPLRYDPAMVADLPEVAQRYFARAISPGTPLHRVVRLEMEGTFVLNGRPMPMRASQVLVPPGLGFVWKAEVGSGLMRFAGSDGFFAPGEGAVDSWTRFWLAGLIPLARIGTNEDHARSAATRVMLESVWAPASLLPQFGAHWTATGPESAVVRFDGAPGIEPMEMVFDGQGNLLSVAAQRWSDANPEKTYRLQPFGGRMLEMGSFQGFLIPTRVELGNHFGTPAWEPFFHASITAAEF